MLENCTFRIFCHIFENNSKIFFVIKFQYQNKYSALLDALKMYYLEKCLLSYLIRQTILLKQIEA